MSASRVYRYIPCESFSQFDSLPLPSLLTRTAMDELRRLDASDALRSLWELRDHDVAEVSLILFAADILCESC